MAFNKDARFGLPAPLEGMVALIVDANVTNRRLVAKLLREHGCTKVHETADIRDADDLLGITIGNLDLALINADLPRISGAGMVKMLRSGKAKGDPALRCLLYHPLADEPLRVIAGNLYAGMMTVPVSSQDFLALVYDALDRLAPDGSRDDFAAVATKWQPQAALAMGAPSEAVYVGMGSPQAVEETQAAALARADQGIEMRLADAVHEDCVLARPLMDRKGQLLAPVGETITVGMIGGWVRGGQLAPSSRLYVVPDPADAKAKQPKRVQR